MAMTDESRALRHRLLDICDAYCDRHADKDTVDFRLGSHEPYGEMVVPIHPESIYETESFSISDEMRQIIVGLVEIGLEIRRLEQF